MYIIEGNIGAGKSTFLKLLSTHIPEVSIALEPLQNWQSEHAGQSLLTNFYQAPERWAYTMETWALTCRVPEHIKDQAHTETPLVVERSIYSGHYCFALNGYMTGFMTDLEWDLYSRFFESMTKACHAPQGFIYMHVDPVIALERIKKRNRTGESTIPLDYLQAIDARHQEFLITKKHTIPQLKDVPVLLLDCSADFERNPEVFTEHCNSIRAFIRGQAGDPALLLRQAQDEREENHARV